ncbi:MAG: hypothetical protein KatS3mg114_0171 [Planctomycetaceae bacterium]|nr:MAG: hypothetical protein KatS3mg114_0171 [Planctomycetaceae bacterium]
MRLREIRSWNLEGWSQALLVLGFSIHIVNIFVRSHLLSVAGWFIIGILILFWIGFVIVCILYMAVLSGCDTIRRLLGK